ncbi:hypothetical protein [Roseobacter sp. HKCCA0882]|uniref:hypothetical protein n=1 Tax=Roseobacter sp. HKCCA0882 TaxID=3120337 RepID=UPI0030EF158E
MRHGIQAFDRATILFQLVTSGLSVLCAFDIPVTLEEAVIYSPDFAAQVRAFGGGSSVPAVAT